ncbi:MAG: sensor histidine kinase [Bacteroidota bacterium]
MNWKKIGLHALPWLAMVLLTYFMYNLADSVKPNDYYSWLPMTLASYMAIFYGYYYRLVPLYLGKNNGVFWVWTIAILLLYPVIKYGWDNLIGVESLAVVIVNLDKGSESVLANHLTWIVEYLRRFFTPLFFIPLSVFVRFTVDWFRNYKRQMELESQNLQSELALLRNQINPHFLFNTLNNIDSMVYKVAPQASDAIVKLSELMRYMLYDANTDEVRLSQEIHHLRSFMDLQKMRLKNHDVHLSLDIGSDQIMIAPMLFIPFVENAFKHGQWSQDAFRVKVELSQMDDTLRFKAVNDFDPSKVDHKDKAGGIGLTNVKRRLELLYADRHDLEISQENGQFTVELSLKP